ncbi:hypothetical protein I5M27_05810 [Adhaeribacter sp. BT258]|uniref:Uncharacterized protein n=1 Tax=Adhaeribacter terrigena TaxID=2793070 RepID=A0ABS1BZ99_9BACT|nr:hypothetical protein [Adhaeribacter terrigena]MBK0402492.1 hypothetical protein [Adhaeribacter terrigena]
MGNNLKKDSSAINVLAGEHNIVLATSLSDVEFNDLTASDQFENAFNKLYATVLAKKLRSLKAELKDQYIISIEPSETFKSPYVVERSVLVKSKADNSLSKISIIRYSEKEEFSIQGLPLYSKPSQLYNKTSLIPFMGTVEEFDPEKFEGYFFQLLHYCFQ